MSETLQIERDGRTPIRTVELVYSPDDGGYYLEDWDMKNERRRLSRGIIASRETIIAKWRGGALKWEKWN